MCANSPAGTRLRKNVIGSAASDATAEPSADASRPRISTQRRSARRSEYRPTSGPATSCSAPTNPDSSPIVFASPPSSITRPGVSAKVSEDAAMSTSATP